MALAVNASFVSPTATAQFAHRIGQWHAHGFMGSLLAALHGVSAWKALLTLLLLCVAYDQFKYIRNKGSIEGDAWKMPFMGLFIQSMRPKFNVYYAKWLSSPVSCVSVFHKFIVIASTRDMARKVFNSPAFVKPRLVDSAHKILRPENWVFLDGREHVDYRRGLNALFTRQALEAYLPGQVDVYNAYLNKFVRISQDQQHGKPVPFMPELRELMCAVSCRTFVGHYMPDNAMKRIADNYYLITSALELVNFPIILPFTKSWYGKRAADVVLEEFAKCAAKSKVRMAAGGRKECILDYWVSSMLESEAYRAKVASGVPVDDAEKPSMLIRLFSDYQISMTLFTFLFASQDATTSAATWLFQIMADRPDLLDRVREENLQARNGDRNAPVTLDMIEKMTYTRAVVKETLRYRPPVIMVPYIAKKPFPITDTYTAPTGSMVVPTIYLAMHDSDAYPDPGTFNPERWITGDAEKQTKNWLVFGAGPHNCIGQTYATSNLMLMIGMASMFVDWKHQVTDLSEEIKVFATIFPMDDCLLTFSERPA